MLFVPAVLTLGMLFVFVPFIVNAVVLWITDKLMANFEIDTTTGLLVSAAAITLVNGMLHASAFSAMARGASRAALRPGLDLRRPDRTAGAEPAASRRQVAARPIDGRTKVVVEEERRAGARTAPPLAGGAREARLVGPDPTDRGPRRRRYLRVAPSSR